MGNSKGGNKKRIASSYISPKSLLYINGDFTPAYSTFYHFTSWLTNYNFFTEITDNDESTRLVVMKDGPNDFNIYQIIKAIDEMESKNIINEFSCCDFNLISEEDAKQKEQESDDNYDHIAFLSNDHNHKGNGNDLKVKRASITKRNGQTDYIFVDDIKEKVSSLIETVYKNAPKKYEKILMKGCPNNLRWFMWMCIAKDKYNVVEQETNISNEQLYHILIQSKIKPVLEAEILQNLQCCVYNISYYYESDKVYHLFNVLKAMALYDKKIGYNRLMNQLAAYMLIVSNFNEVEAFLMIRFFLSSEYGIGLRELMLEDMPQMHQFVFIMRYFIEERMPSIHDTILDYNISNSAWLIQWIKTLFIDLVPFGVCIRIWDCLMIKGVEFFYNYILGLIKLNENDLEQAVNEADFVSSFRIQLNNDDDIVLFREKTINLSDTFTITPEMIKQVEEKYEISSQRNISIMKIEYESRKNERKEVNVIRKLVEKSKGNYGLKHKEYKPCDLNLDSLEINEEKHATVEKTLEEMFDLNMQMEYVNVISDENKKNEEEDDVIDNNNDDEEKTDKASKAKSIGHIYSYKQNETNNLRANRVHKFQTIMEEKYEDAKETHIKRDTTLNDFSFDEEYK